MAKSWRDYIENEDFEGALDRFNSTSRNWKRHWFDVCQQIAENCKEWLKEYILDPINLTILPKAKKVYTKWKTKVDTNEVNLLDNAKEKCYLFRFFDKDGKRVCSKVGTTTRKVMTRLREELRSDTYVEMGCVSAIVDRVYDCGNRPAEGLESYIRAEYIKRYPESFKKNDRFINLDFDLELVDQLMREYLGA